jgi:succinyl-CoA synthetase beta subunit
MDVLNRCISGLLVIFLTGLYFPKSVSCADPQLIVKVDKNAITRHEPKVMAAEEKEIPKVKVEEKKQKGLNKYLWIGLGTLLVGGTVAALAGTGGGSSDDSNDNTSGDFRAEW